MQITVNNRPAFSLDFPNPPTDIVGVHYRFHGGGSIRDAHFVANGKTIELK
jgi:hypothetical protein